MEGDDIPDTRVFVSGMPAKFTSNQLGAHFAGRYQITDAVVVPDRRIGFVGFRNYTLAKSAIKYFDKTYIRMSKISVEMAKPIERTSNSPGMSRLKHSNQDHLASSLPSSPAPRNGDRMSITGSNNDASFQPYVPIVSLNEKKRKLRNEPDDEHSKPTLAVDAAPATAKPENGLRKYPGEEGGEKYRGFEGAKIENKAGKAHKVDLERRTRDVQGHEKISMDSMDELKKRKAEANMLRLQDEDVAIQARSGLESQDKKKEKKRKRNIDDSNIEVDSQNDHADNLSVHRKKELRKGTNSRSQVDSDTKGGVEPIGDDMSKSPGQSADQINQQRRKSENTSDNDWLRAKTSRLLDLTDPCPQNVSSVFPNSGGGSKETTVNGEAEDTEMLGTSQQFPVTTTNDSYSSGRLFVRNLPYATSESNIEELFSKYGQLDEVHLLRDKAGSSKGVAYIQFSNDKLARHALEQLDGKPFQGRLLHIMEAADKRSHKLDDYEISKLPLRTQKALKRKMEAGGSSFSWNSMYMNPNAVLSSVADRLGVPKAELIDASSSDAAVRQAHAETHVIQETKAFLASNGINLDAFRQNERDERTLLIKNFPFGTTADDLKSLFGPYGEIVRFLLAPSGTHAIIQYAQPGEGAQAIRHLAYRNMKGSVLYLEKAPKDLFDRNWQPHLNRTLSSDAATKHEDPDSPKVEECSSCTLFVRNLNFTTTSSGLAYAFKPLSGFLSARVKTKIDPRRPQEILSMGFGFVEFSSNQQAQAALAAMNGSRLENHDLLVQISHKATDAAEDQRIKDNSRKAEARRTKIIIKNLPFEATKKDVRALLSAYGQLRSVKVPQKFDRSTRGFSFADFVTAKEAENAMEALKHTHLLGRRLVLEFADEESVDPEDEIRAIESKVGRQAEIIQASKITGSAREKFNIGTPDHLRQSL